VPVSPADSGTSHLHGDAHPPVTIDCRPLMFQPSTGDLELSIRFKGLVEGFGYRIDVFINGYTTDSPAITCRKPENGRVSGDVNCVSTNFVSKDYSHHLTVALMSPQFHTQPAGNQMRFLIDIYDTFPGLGPEMALIGMKDQSRVVPTERFTIPPAQVPKNKGAYGDDNRVDEGFSCSSVPNMQNTNDCEQQNRGAHSRQGKEHAEGPLASEARMEEEKKRGTEGARHAENESASKPSVIVFLFLPSCEMSKDPEVCVQKVQRLSPVLKNAYEVVVFFALLIEREEADLILTATGCSRVSLIHRQQHGSAMVLGMDMVQAPVGGAIVLMSDDLIYPFDYLDRVLKMVRGAAQSIGGKFVLGQEGYVLSASMGSKWSSEDGCEDNSELNGKWVHVLRLGTIAIPVLSDHYGQPFLSQLMGILKFHPHMRHVAFANLAEVNDVLLLMIMAPSSTSFDSGETPSQWQVQDWHPSDAEFRFLPNDFGVLPHCNLLSNRETPWQPNSSAWTGWLHRSYRSVSFSSQLANLPILSQKLNQIGTECDESIWNTPVAVMSQPHDLERRSHISRLLETVGFRNVSFPETIKWSDINIEQMTVRGVLSTSFFRRIQRRNDTNFVGYLRYTANAVSQVQRIRAAAAAKEPIIIMEDDLMLGATVQTIQDILCNSLALKNLPPSADMIYLEYCHEKCDELAYNDQHPNLARAVRPSCSAAILFTVKGAQRVANLCWPVFDVIDRMYPSLIRTGWLEAYILTPPVFYQDGFFRSNLERTTTRQGAGRYHSPHSKNDPPCLDILNLAHVFGERFRDFDLDWRQIGLVIPVAEGRSILGMLEGGDRVNEVCRYGNFEAIDMTGQERGSFVWLKYGMPVSWTGLSYPGAQIIFTVLSGSSDEGGILVGSWDTASSCGALLDLDVDNDCAGWQSGEACRLESSLVSVDGVVDDVLRFSIFLVDMRTDKSGPVLQDPFYRVSKERQEALIN
jgi:hypothetical protein